MMRRRLRRFLRCCEWSPWYSPRRCCCLALYMEGHAERVAEGMRRELMK